MVGPETEASASGLESAAYLWRKCGAVLCPGLRAGAGSGSADARLAAEWTARGEVTRLRLGRISTDPRSQCARPSSARAASCPWGPSSPRASQPTWKPCTGPIRTRKRRCFRSHRGVRCTPARSARRSMRCCRRSAFRATGGVETPRAQRVNSCLPKLARASREGVGQSRLEHLAAFLGHVSRSTGDTDDARRWTSLP